MALRVGIVEDQRTTREGLAALVSGSPGLACAGAWESMEDALPALTREPPEVALLDIGLPGMSGIEGVRRLRGERPHVQVLMLTVYDDDEHVFEAVCAGACGYLLKDTPPERLVLAIREAAAGGAPMTPEIARRVLAMFRAVAPPPGQDHRLSPREVEVLQLLADGHSYKTAASELDLSIDTIRFHVRRCYEKLHVHSKSEAVAVALRRGILR